MQIDVRPLTPAEWPELAALFDEGGDPKWCWCMYWRQRSRDFNHSTAAESRARLLDLVEQDRPPGLVAFADGRAVGWVSVGPRTDYERIERSTRIGRVDDRPAWAIVCFAVSRHVRGRGIARALLTAAIAYARDGGAEVLEAYPVSIGESRIPAAAAFTGTLAMFERAGFERVELTRSVSGGHPRAIVRLELATPRESR